MKRGLRLKSTRRIHCSEFKTRVAIEAISVRKTIQEIAVDHVIHPIQVCQWKKPLLDGGSELFTPGKKSKDKEASHPRDSPVWWTSRSSGQRRRSGLPLSPTTRLERIPLLGSD